MTVDDTSWLDDPCPIARAVSVLGQRWAVLIIREALMGRTRFSEFRERLGVASDVLSARLSQLVAAGIMEVIDYREPGDRTRGRYVLTDAGRDVAPVLGALGQWGTKHFARIDNATLRFVETETNEPVGVGFRRKDGSHVPRRAVGLVNLGPTAPRPVVSHRR